MLNNLASDQEEVAAKLRRLGCLSLKEEVEQQMERTAGEARRRQKQDGAPGDERSIPNTRTRTEAEPEEIEDVLPSMKLTAEVKDRLIRPEEKVLSGRNLSVSMSEFVPSRSLRGMEDFADESEYYDSYQRVEEAESGFRVHIRPPAKP